MDGTVLPFTWLGLSAQIYMKQSTILRSGFFAIILN